MNYIKKIIVLFLALSLIGCKKPLNEYNVVFDAMGGSLKTGDSSVTVVQEGSEISDLENPVREGYTFEGWYTDETCETKYQIDTKVSNDMTLYAKWSPISYTVTFETDGAKNAEVFSSKEVEYGKTAPQPIGDPEKDNLNFDGWYEDEGRTIPYDFNTPILADTTIYAGFSSTVYDLTKQEGFVFQSQVRDPYVWMGCETAALMMALKTTGHILDMSYSQMLKELPMTDSDNPYLGFCGDLYSDTWMRDAVMPNIIAEWGANYGNTKDLTKQGLEPVIEAIKNGHPVVVWTSSHMVPSSSVWDETATGLTDDAVDPITGEVLNYFGSTGSKWEYKTKNHVMTLVGYNTETKEFELADPAEWLGPTYWVTYDTFMNSWDCYQGAVEVW